ncbi:NAD-dependent glycerol-3-phosphate dehydrogenase domain protein [Coriobacterium glomerans PW2]|uniref:Glycerol-3-phosphate dehydrogenase [NAD(P)+] n=1 Tax=Coriobacterium glomerans (strain ATCC 49209 / DSM 20642 / JCM 10262 / PW2) TaxID=700015 RepID=F2N9J3_CORGP|nr:NAD(P)H-dependent glycerol-3-phosphate dehydrogenase [Coriobacterium glomerans]AEB07022.1 NAD-dependent glycerol-3-phosphate dehydrogenase domain protein [Coriobacterium glomerans PW2]
MRIAIIGAGSWGTAVAGLCAARADQVVMWAHDPSIARSITERHRNPRYLVEYELSGRISAEHDLVRSLRGAEAVIFATPSAYLRERAREAAGHVARNAPVLCLSKGIEPESGKLMTEVVAEELGCAERIAALSGPNHAEEVCRGGLSAAVCAATEGQVAEWFRDLLISLTFRVYLSDDPVGVEMCGAVKNVIAIVCGIACGSGYGDNTLAMIMTRGLAEISRLVYARGGDPLTCMGLAGMGDLVATCTSPHSRNRGFGLACASGTALSTYERRTHMVVEGAAAALSVAQLAREIGVDAPITFALESIIYGNASIREALEVLMDRLPTEEFYGVGKERGIPCEKRSV